MADDEPAVVSNVTGARTARANVAPGAGVAGARAHPTTRAVTRTRPTKLFIDWFGRRVGGFVQSRRRRV